MSVDIDLRRQAWLAFASSAIAGHIPRKVKYKVGELADEIVENSLSIADEMLDEYIEREELKFEPIEAEEEEEEEEEEEDDRPARGRRRARR